MGITNKMKKNLSKPIIMETNPARGHMPHALAVADDQAAIDRHNKLDNYEKELKKDSAKNLQEKADEIKAAELIKKAKEELAMLQGLASLTKADEARIKELKEELGEEEAENKPGEGEEPPPEDVPIPSKKKTSKKKNPFEKK